MATWIAHLRIAENLLRRGCAFDPEPFLTGSLGPDSGIPNDDWSTFDPPKRISHWQNASGAIEPERFYERYLVGRVPSDPATTFMIGYYLHLVADVEWLVSVWQPKKQEPLYREGLARDSNFIWEIKKDWYDLDFLYLRENPGSAFFTHFIHYRAVPDYLDYFPPGAFTRQLGYIQDYYLNRQPDLDRPFIYLSQQELDRYVDRATAALAAVIEGRCWR